MDHVETVLAEVIAVALSNLASPMVLFFVLGFAAALAGSDLAVPEPVAKALALYLMLAIGFKGGVALSQQGLNAGVLAMLAAGAALSFLMPFLAFAMLKATRLGPADAAAVAAHYGSISIVTFVTATEFLKLVDVGYAGTMVAVVAVMETPAIVSGLWLARRAGGTPERRSTPPGLSRELGREIALNGSVVLLVGAFVIGWISGDKGLASIGPFVEAPFKGVLCLFLLDMGLVAAHRFRDVGGLTARLLAFGIVMPLVGAMLGMATARLLGLGLGETALFGVLAGSASYIAVPAAMRLALPAANPAIYLTLSLAITFPFNLTIGIPVYFTVARLIAPG